MPVASYIAGDSGLAVVSLLYTSDVNRAVLIRFACWAKAQFPFLSILASLLWAGKLLRRFVLNLVTKTEAFFGNEFWRQLTCFNFVCLICWYLASAILSFCRGKGGEGEEMLIFPKRHPSNVLDVAIVLSIKGKRAVLHQKKRNPIPNAA